MDKKLLLVKIAGQRIFFNPELSIAFEQTAFPTDGLMFKPHVEFFWLVEMVEYESATGKLTVKVLDYQPSDTKAFATQTPKRQVNALFFSEKLDWTHLEPQLSHYAKARLSHLVKNIDAEKKHHHRRRLKRTKASFTIPSACHSMKCTLALGMPVLPILYPNWIRKLISKYPTTTYCLNSITSGFGLPKSWATER